MNKGTRMFIVGVAVGVVASNLYMASKVKRV